MSAARQKPALGIALRLRAFGHVGNFEILEDIQIPGVMDDQLMTGLMGIRVPHVLFVPLIAGRFLLGFTAVPRCLLAARGPPLPFFALPLRLLQPGLLNRLQIENLPLGCRQGLGDPTISAERTLGAWVGRQVAQILGYSLGRDVGIFSR